VRRISGKLVAIAAFAVPILVASIAQARSATLTVGARLREGPSKATTLLSTVPAGTTVELLDEQNGWQHVQLPDGRTGWVWHEHLAGSPTATEPPAPAAPAAVPAAAQPAAPAAAAVPAAGNAVLDELRALRAEVDALRQRPDPAAEIDALRAEVRRLASAQQDGERARVPHPMGEAGDGLLGVAAVFLLVGLVVGMIASRLAQRRRERRQRIRI